MYFIGTSFVELLPVGWVSVHIQHNLCYQHHSGESGALPCFTRMGWKATSPFSLAHTLWGKAAKVLAQTCCL